MCRSYSRVPIDTYLGHHGIGIEGSADCYKRATLY